MIMDNEDHVDAIEEKREEKWAVDQVSVVNSLKKSWLEIPINIFFLRQQKFDSAAAVYNIRKSNIKHTKTK